MDAARVGAVLTKGTPVHPVGDLEGQEIDNGYAPSSIWMRLADHTYLPNAFVLTGYDGWTPSLPFCDESSTAAGENVDSETPETFDGLAISNDRVSTQLLNHYYDGTGNQAVIDWAFFQQGARFRTWLTTLSADSMGRVYESSAVDDGDIYWAVGAFSAARTSEHCYVIKDDYDFAPDKVSNAPFIFSWADSVFGSAAPFIVRASGCNH
ncbi:MAG: hypothetical protein EON52_00010 [Actinomycetales bacterium]|nr:MAG: hypothetical protein EON52_00010 [Actinomycetales bacterium]